MKLRNLHLAFFLFDIRFDFIKYINSKHSFTSFDRTQQYFNTCPFNTVTFSLAKAGKLQNKF